MSSGVKEREAPRGGEEVARQGSANRAVAAGTKALRDKKAKRNT